MMFFYTEGSVTLLFVPFGHSLDDEAKRGVERVLSENGFQVPDWDEGYNDVLEGYILDSDLEQRPLQEAFGPDDHVDAYLNVMEEHHLTEELRRITGIVDVMLCSGETGYVNMNMEEKEH
jgi:hypothetical protein